MYIVPNARASFILYYPLACDNICGYYNTNTKVRMFIKLVLRVSETLYQKNLVRAKCASVHYVSQRLKVQVSLK